MTEVARITRHPSDRDVVLVHTPHGLQNEMGRFAPARYSPEHRAYVLHGDHIAALYRFAKTISLHVVDERRATAGYKTLPVECASCQQPGSMGRPPKVCPACGEPWVPVPPPVSEEAKGRYECPSCRHRQSGRFPFCAECGARMEYERVAAPVVPLEPRRRHGEPVRFGDALEAWGERRQVMPTPKQPWVPQIHKGRPVETVELLEDHPELEDPPEEPGW